MASATLDALIDTYINSSQTTTNYGEGTQVILASGKSGLFKFDFSGIPSGSIIDSATLRIKVEAVVNSSDAIFNIYRVYRAWVEGEATWNVYSTGNSWGTAGCLNTTTDRTSTVMGTKTINDVQEYSIALLASEAQSMFENNQSLIIVFASGAGGSYKYVKSSEASSEKPVLDLVYTPPANIAPFMNWWV